MCDGPKIFFFSLIEHFGTVSLLGSFFYFVSFISFFRHPVDINIKFCFYFISMQFYSIAFLFYLFFFFHYLQNSNSMKSLIFFFICYKIKFYLLYLTVILKSTKHRIWLNAILTFQNRILSIHQRHIVLVSKSLSSDIWVNPYRCVVWESIMWTF